MSRFFALVFIILSLLKSPCEGQEDIFRQFTQEASDSLVATFLQDTQGLTSETALINSLDVAKEVNLLLKERIEKALAGKKLQYQRQEVTDQKRSYLIEFDIVKFALALDFLISDSQFQIDADMAVFFRITDQKEGRILKEKEYQLKYQRFYSMLTFAQKMSQDPPALIDEKKTRGGRIVEPILLSGVTGIVIYLFYALRSR